MQNDSVIEQKKIVNSFLVSGYGRFSIPVYRIDSDSNPEKYATCFMLDTDSGSYIVTAKHVYFPWMGDGYVVEDPYFSFGLSPESIPIVKENHVRPSGSSYDFIIVKLSNQQKESILGSYYSCITTEMCDLVNSVGRKSLFLCCGYPNSDNEPDFDNLVLKSNLLIMHCSLHTTTKRNNHLVLKAHKMFKPRESIDPCKIEHAPEGMSGCPIWNVTSTNEGISFHLKGLLHEYNPSSGDYIGEWVYHIIKTIQSVFEKKPALT